MSWVHLLAPGHRGDLLGLVPRQGGEPARFGDDYRELDAETDGAVTTPWYGHNLTVLQLGCTCGWRSDRIIDEVPTVAIWAGWVDVRVEFLEQCRKRWLAHAIGTVKGQQGATDWVNG